MAREAAYLGIPAFSIFKGKKCAVDRYLESLGELVFIESSAQLTNMSFQKSKLQKKPQSGARVLEEIVTELLTRTKNAA